MGKEKIKRLRKIVLISIGGVIGYNFANIVGAGLGAMIGAWLASMIK